MSEPNLTHLDEKGAARMVDVAGKPIQRRRAVASGKLFCSPATLALLRDGQVPKGDAFAAARIAGILAAKRTDELIPLCHSLPVNSASVDFEYIPEGVLIRAEITTDAKTGIEMEALTAVSVAALTLYDMLKAVDKGMRIGDIVLELKEKS
jgi:cyclic pyranopterin phosphate synthase